MRHGHRVDRLPVPVALRVPAPVRVPAAGLAAWTRTGRSLRRVLAYAAAAHLHRAAAILRQAPSVDWGLLGPAGTADVIDALDPGAVLSARLAASTTGRLRRWATTLQRANSPAGRPAPAGEVLAPLALSTTPGVPRQERHAGLYAAQPDAQVVLDEPINEQVQWHLAETAAALRHAPAPLDPALLGAVLHGLAELCWLLHDRCHETSARPTVLFGDHPVVGEALGMWARRVDALITQPDGTARP